MNHNIVKKLGERWDTFKKNVEVADVAFIFLRVIILWGGIGWLVFSDISQRATGYVAVQLFAFVTYCTFFYIWLFNIIIINFSFYSSI